MSLDPIFGVIEEACLAGAEAALRAGGSVPEPQVHMFIDRWEQPYASYVLCRPYRRGRDAAEAIAGLGAAPAAIKATRILIGGRKRTGIELSPGPDFGPCNRHHARLNFATTTALLNDIIDRICRSLTARA